jgi:hypothetical protein
MKLKYFIFILSFLFLISCAKPYKASLFREAKLAGNQFNSVLALGVALNNKIELSSEAKKAIKIALDEQAKAHAVAIYSIDEYQRFSGFMGAGGTEQSLNNLLNKSIELKEVIQRYLGTGREVK